MDLVSIFDLLITLREASERVRREVGRGLAVVQREKLQKT